MNVDFLDRTRVYSLTERNLIVKKKSYEIKKSETAFRQSLRLFFVNRCAFVVFDYFRVAEGENDNEIRVVG